MRVGAGVTAPSMKILNHHYAKAHFNRRGTNSF